MQPRLHELIYTHEHLSVAYIVSSSLGSIHIILYHVNLEQPLVQLVLVDDHVVVLVQHSAQLGGDVCEVGQLLRGDH